MRIKAPYENQRLDKVSVLRPLIVVIALLLASVSWAQEAVSNADAAPIKAEFQYDATTALVDQPLKEGLNLVMPNPSGLQLRVSATAGELLEYVILDRDGKPIEPMIAITEKTAKKTTYWECGKDANGDTHCWKVPCPVIVGPWSPGKVLRAGLRFERLTVPPERGKLGLR